MISRRELEQLQAEWSLETRVIEKDYVLGWLLAGIAQHPSLAQTWIFKGGTCLRKCYYETYRFSEDLDFTIVDDGPEDPADLLPIFTEIATWVFEESGIELQMDDKAFRRRRNRREKPTTEGRIGYRGPNPRPTAPKVKLDLTSDEAVVSPPTRRRIQHAYSDSLSQTEVLCYPIADLFGEKIRALA
jgi:predicted nucleotidyltransferase component of viral defense system